MRKKLFGTTIEPACEYCEKGHPTTDGHMIICKARGIVMPFYSCKKYIYNPLKRTPSALRPLPEYDEKDFSL